MCYFQFQRSFFSFLFKSELKSSGYFQHNLGTESSHLPWLTHMHLVHGFDLVSEVYFFLAFEGIQAHPSKSFSFSHSYFIIVYNMQSTYIITITSVTVRVTFENRDF